MIAIDLCKVNYETLLITYLKLIIKNTQHVKKNQIKSKCDYIGFKDNRLRYECKKCLKKCSKSIDGLIKNFSNIYQFCNGDLNKFVLLLRKGVYPYEYMDSWERFDEKLFIAN